MHHNQYQNIMKTLAEIRDLADYAKVIDTLLVSYVLNIPSSSFIASLSFSESSDSYYKGQTDDLADRLFRHNNGREKVAGYCILKKFSIFGP